MINIGEEVARFEINEKHFVSYLDRLLAKIHRYRVLGFKVMNVDIWFDLLKKDDKYLLAVTSKDDYGNWTILIYEIIGEPRNIKEVLDLIKDQWDDIVSKYGIEMVYSL